MPAHEVEPLSKMERARLVRSQPLFWFVVTYCTCFTGGSAACALFDMLGLFGNVRGPNLWLLSLAIAGPLAWLVRHTAGRTLMKSRA
jgi:hypothetical protein